MPAVDGWVHVGPSLMELASGKMGLFLLLSKVVLSLMWPGLNVYACSIGLCLTYLKQTGIPTTVVQPWLQLYIL